MKLGVAGLNYMGEGDDIARLDLFQIRILTFQ